MNAVNPREKHLPSKKYFHEFLLKLIRKSFFKPLFLIETKKNQMRPFL